MHYRLVNFMYNDYSHTCADLFRINYVEVLWKIGFLIMRREFLKNSSGEVHFVKKVSDFSLHELCPYSEFFCSAFSPHSAEFSTRNKERVNFQQLKSNE